MSLIPWPSAGGSPVNRDDVLERVGISTTGQLTSVTSGAANAKGASWTDLTTGITGPFSGFTLIISGGSNTAAFLLDISLDGGSTIHVPDLYVLPTALQAGYVEISLPLNVTAGNKISVKSQSNAATQVLGVGVIGRITNANSQPLWTQCEPIAAVNKSSFTRLAADAKAITLAIGAGSWVEITTNATGATRAYGALLPMVGQSATSPGGGKAVEVQFGIGAVASEVWIASIALVISNSTPLVARGYIDVLQKAVASGQHLHARALAAAAGTPDTLLPNLYGFF